MTRRLLALAATALAAGALTLTAAPADACQPDYCPQTPTCQYVRATCIHPF